MRAIILAGGKGTRISELYPEIPKPMIPICGKPVIQYQVENLVAQEFTEIIIIIGHLGDQIRDHFGDGGRFGARISYYTEATPLGTGGALAALEPEDSLILFGDILCDISFRQFIDFHHQKRAGITLFTHPNSHPNDSDIVEVDVAGKVIDWHSKNKIRENDLRNLVNAGLYIVSNSCYPYGAIEKRDLDRDIVLPLVVQGRVYAYRSTEYVKDMGTPDRLESVTQAVKSGMMSARNLEHRQKAVFIDRDGTINAHVGLISVPDQLKLLDGSAEAIRLLNGSEYISICVTNQPVIARGMVTLGTLNSIHARLDTLLGHQGAYLDDLIFCPHHPDKGYPEEVPAYKIECECRKPKAGMLFQAAARYSIDLTQSFMIGDTTADILCGLNAGCKTIGVKTGEALCDGKYDAVPSYVAENLLDAAKSILGK